MRQGIGKRKEAPQHKARVVALDEIACRVRGERRYILSAQDAERGEWLAMRVSESRKEEAWVALLDQLWDRAISPDSGVEWVVCDGDLAIEAAVEIAYPGVKTQRCVWHLLKKAREALEKRYPGQGNAEHRSHLMGMIRGLFTTTREMEAHARFRTLAQEDASLARYLWPQIKKGLEYLRSPEKGVPSTTSRMERAIREYRRRTRPMDGFKTDSGAENFNQLWMMKERAKKRGQDWLRQVMN